MVHHGRFAAPFLQLQVWCPGGRLSRILRAVSQRPQQGDSPGFSPSLCVWKEGGLELQSEHSGNYRAAVFSTGKPDTPYLKR